MSIHRHHEPQDPEPGGLPVDPDDLPSPGEAPIDPEDGATEPPKV